MLPRLNERPQLHLHLPLPLHEEPIRTTERKHLQPAPIPAIVSQHVEESAHLRTVRAVLVRAPHVRLLQLARIDERIAAHLDGIAVAGDAGVAMIQRALERPGVGEIFVAAVRALEDRDATRLDKLLSITEALRPSRAGLLSAFGWVSGSQLQGTTMMLLAAVEPWRREVGLAACALHGVNPGSALDQALRDADASLRARALRAAGQCGRRDLMDACLDACLDAMSGDEKYCAFEAARAALLLGDRHASVAALEAIALDPAAAAACPRALRTVLKVVAPARAKVLLASLAALAETAPMGMRTLMQAVATAGDPHYLPWLIAQMHERAFARVASEAFTMITGVDLAQADLELKPPNDVELGPGNNPAQADIAMDDDESLPWPDVVKIRNWWQANGAQFTVGSRYFMGEPPNPSKCLDVLKNSSQRQRIEAAEYLTLLAPGTPLFNTHAPAWRQQRALAKLTPAPTHFLHDRSHS